MLFSLKYEGLLRASQNGSGRVAEKNRLRWHFHNQLERLLREGDFSRLPEYKKTILSRQPLRIDWSAAPDVRVLKGIAFNPVIDRNLRIACELRVRIDRSERPGALLQDGDLDNRIKTLFDALRVPKNDNEVLPDEENPAANYCVCLLDDDSMITAFAVETHASLEAIPKGEVKLNIDIEIGAHARFFDVEP